MALKDLDPSQRAEAQAKNIEPLNDEVVFSGKASSFRGLTSTGLLLIGDSGIEYYSQRNVQDFLQIPWEEVDYVSASVVGGKRITRFAVFTRRDGHFDFSCRDNKAALRAMRGHVPEDRLQRSPNFVEVATRGAASVGRGVKGLFKKE